MKTIVTYSILSLFSLTGCNDRFLQRKYTHFSPQRNSINALAVQKVSLTEKTEPFVIVSQKEDLRDDVVKSTLVSEPHENKKTKLRPSFQKESAPAAAFDKRGKLHWMEKERVIQSYDETNRNIAFEACGIKQKQNFDATAIIAVILLVFVITIVLPIIIALGYMSYLIFASSL